MKSRRGRTYAAMAPKISVRLALVTRVSTTAKAAVSIRTMASLAATFLRKYRSRMRPSKNNSVTEIVTIVLTVDSLKRP